MLRYLSDKWLDALDDTLRAAPELTALAPLVVEQVVCDVPGDDVVRYVVVVDANGAQLARGGNPPPADVRLTTDYETACAIAQGMQNAQIALARGRLRLGGNVDALTRHASAFAALTDVSARLRATTTFDPP